MDEDKRIKPRVFVEIDNEQKMHVIGHNHEIARRQRRVKPVNRQPQRLHAFAGPAQDWPFLALDQARQHGPSSSHAERKEEELQAVMGEAEVHRQSDTSISYRIQLASLSASCVRVDDNGETPLFHLDGAQLKRRGLPGLAQAEAECRLFLT